MFKKKVNGGDWKLPFFEEGEEIPKLIHQIFFYPIQLPDELKDNIEILKVRNPTWKHHIYDDADIQSIIAEIYGARVLDYINRINPKYGAAKADLFRYLLLYKFGGVYLDIKSNCLNSFDDVIEPSDRFILTHWKNQPGQQHEGFGKQKELMHIPNGEFQQWHIITAAGHPFLREIIERVLNNIDKYNPWFDGTGGTGVLKLTGPVAYTLAIYPILGQHKHRVIDTDVIGLQYNALAKSHKVIFKSHYLSQTESIIKFRGYKKISGQIYSMARLLKRQFSELFKSR